MAEKIDLIEVKSSNIKGVGYSEDSKTLVVEFKNTSLHHYKDVPLFVYQSLMASDSIGRYMHQNVIGKYSNQKIR